MCAIRPFSEISSESKFIWGAVWKLRSEIEIRGFRIVLRHAFIPIVLVVTRAPLIPMICFCDSFSGPAKLTASIHQIAPNPFFFFNFFERLFSSLLLSR
jgi:hypothetical protein